MTTNLLIAYPTILKDAATITSNVSYETDKPLKHIVLGGRQNTARVNPPDFQPVITITMPSGDTRTVEYMIVAKAHLLSKIGGTRLYVKASDPGVESDIIGTLVNLQTRTFLGPKQEDLIFTSDLNNEVSGIFPTTAARVFKLYYGSDATLGPEMNPFYFEGHVWSGLRNPDAENLENRYWIDGVPAANIPQFYGYEGAPGGYIDAYWEFSKLYMGLFFDMGRDPLYPRSVLRAYYKGPGEKRPHYTFRLEWRGISNAKVEELEWNIIRYRDVSPVFLYTRANHALLQGDRLVHCKIADYSARLYAPNSNSVSITFEEQL